MRIKRGGGGGGGGGGGEGQLLSGRVLDSRLRGSRFEPHLRHCVVFLTKTLIICLVLV